jgi:hypothetical protein
MVSTVGPGSVYSGRSCGGHRPLGIVGDARMVQERAPLGTLTVRVQATARPATQPSSARRPVTVAAV